MHATRLLQEPNGSVITLISMNGSRSQLKQKADGPELRRIPVRPWQHLSFAVPLKERLARRRIERLCAHAPGGHPGVAAGHDLLLKPFSQNPDTCRRAMDRPRIAHYPGVIRERPLSRYSGGRGPCLNANSQEEGGYAASLAGKPGRGPSFHAPGSSRAEAA
jgi:hypothetical protein